jgi:predicted transcriptional regulator
LVIPQAETMAARPTTLKIPEELKKRVDAAAQAADTSPHAFMLGAIEAQTRLDEQRRSFLADAAAADREMLSTGEGYAAHDVHRYFLARARRKKAARPKSIKWRK